IWARAGDQEPVARVLEARLGPPHNLSHGYHPGTTAGLPRLAGASFRGEYPFATIDFEDARLPLRIGLEAFTPLIPLDPEDSGLPCAIRTYTIANTSPEPVALTLAGSIVNPVGGLAYDRYGNLAPRDAGQNVNEYRDDGGLRGLFLSSQQMAPGELRYGS